MGELAGDECIIRKRAASCILPRKCRCDCNRPFLPDPVLFNIQVGQGGAEKPNRNKESSISRLVRIGSSSGLHHSKARAYLGNAAAMAFAPSSPISFQPTLSVVNGALKKQS